MIQKELEDIKRNERTIITVTEESRISRDLDEWRFREELLWK